MPATLARLERRLALALMRGDVDEVHAATSALEREQERLRAPMQHLCERLHRIYRDLSFMPGHWWSTHTDLHVTHHRPAHRIYEDPPRVTISSNIGASRNLADLRIQTKCVPARTMSVTFRVDKYSLADDEAQTISDLVPGITKFLRLVGRS